MQRLLIATLFLFLPSLPPLVSAQNTSPLGSRQKEVSTRSADFIKRKTIVNEVVFRGLGPTYDEYGDENIYEAASESRILEELRSRRVAIEAEDIFDPDRVDVEIKAVKEILSTAGYFKANITSLGKKLANNRMTLIFAIEKGPLTRVSGMHFSGTHNFSNEELVETMRACLGSQWGTYDMRHIEFCSQKYVRELMWGRGYFEALISAPLRRFIQNSKDVEISFHVAEGVRYRLGEIKVEGVKALSEKEILELFGQHSGDVANGKALQDFVYEKLKRLYADKGYLNYDAEFDPTLNPPATEGLDATVNVKIVVDEGPVFKVNQIVITGVDDKTERELVHGFALKVDDIFNRTKLEEDIRKIDEMNEYLKVDFDRDVELRAVDESSRVDVVIKLRPLDN